jgi:hypothetical protein
MGVVSMIVFITSCGHGYTLQRLRRRTFGFPLPRIRVMNYEQLFRARRVPRATYVFTDFERLTPFELRLSADCYRGLRTQGIRCLNDPARVKTRVRLLQDLYRSGINPFTVHRADETPTPSRFPVFLRWESDHGVPLSGLLQTQADLDHTLQTLESGGTPLRGVLVVEFCGEASPSGLWHKWGTFRIGSATSVDHIAVDDTWLVKYGDWDKLTTEVVAEEHEAVAGNSFAADLDKAFTIAGIEFGRADHATVQGRTIVYEINTNPYFGRYVPDPLTMRRETQMIARARTAKALAAIDCPATGRVTIASTPLLRKSRRWRFGLLSPKRP